MTIRSIVAACITLLILAALPASAAAARPVSSDAAAAAVTLFSHRAKPRALKRPIKRRTEIGLRFLSRVDGRVTGMRFYRAPGRAGRSRANMWLGNGRRVGTRTFRIGRGSGWQVVRFHRPIRVQANRTYTVSFSSSSSFHARTPDGFRSLDRNAMIRVPRAGGGVFRWGSGFPNRGRRSTNNWVDVIVVSDSNDSTAAPEEIAPPGSDPSSTTPGTPAPPASPTEDPGPPGPVTPNTTTANPAAGYPSLATTGVPDGVALTPYDGPCTITVDDTVIDSRRMSCNVTIRARGVVIRNSYITGPVEIRPQDLDGVSGVSIGDYPLSRYSLLIEDSEIHIGPMGATGLQRGNYIARRIEITGGGRSAFCDWGCTIEDSYIHGQQPPPNPQYVHMSGVRMGQNLVLRHNTVSCEGERSEPNNGCSASRTGYGDWAPVQNNLIISNIFYGRDGGGATFCVRGGTNADKPFGNDANNVRFISNVFVRGSNGKCGEFDSNASFDPTRPGNVWRDNVWDDGTCAAIRGQPAC